MAWPRQESLNRRYTQKKQILGSKKADGSELESKELTAKEFNRRWRGWRR